LSQRSLFDAHVWEALEGLDQQLAEEARARGCPRDGGRLHRADYPRKPRGPAGMGRGDVRRRSFCCQEQGCRCRVTPASVRFLGRRVYLGAVVVLASVLRQGVTPWRTQRVKALCGVSAKTLWRWRRWWSAQWPQHEDWRVAWERLAARVVADETGPQSLLEAFEAGGAGALLALLGLLRPLSVSP
jgi:hypothetical protein